AEIAGGGVGDAQYLGGSCLLFQRVECLGDEAGVLYCDDALDSKILQQGDFLVGKWTDFPTSRGNHADQRATSAQRHTQQRVYVFKFARTSRDRIVGLGHIVDMGEPVTLDERTGRRVGGGRI